MVLNWKRVYLIKDYSLFNLPVKKGFGGKIMHDFYFFMGRKAFFHEEKHFAEL